MSNINIYSLPKDLLFKLICTIREDLDKKYQNEIKELEEGLKECEIFIDRCRNEGCSKFNIMKNGLNFYEQLYSCAYCWETFYCVDHLDNFFIYANESEGAEYYICRDCDKFGSEMENGMRINEMNLVKKNEI